MPEPIDTIRRVNSDEAMTLNELYQARAVLDKHSRSDKTDVREARRRVGAMIDELEPKGTDAAVSGSSAAAPAFGERSAEAAKKKTSPAAAAVVLVLLGIGGIFAATRGGGGDSEDGRDDIGAAIVCENFVEDRLRAPSTAEFPSTSDYDISGSGSVYTVRGYVDSENGFGAMIRSDWTCVVQETGTEGEFRLESLTGLG